MFSERTFKTRDGVKLHLVSFIPDDPKGIILLVHGIGEHVGRYQEHFGRLNECGYGCIAFDLRGHGKSEGKRGHVGSYTDLLDDVREISDDAIRIFADIPLFLYGHSLGGNIVFNYLLKRHPGSVQGAIITSPWIRLRINPPALKVALAQLMNVILPAYSENNKLDPAHLSRDERVVSNYKSDPLVHQQISARLFMGALRAGEYILQHTDSLEVPVLLIHGESDPITSPDASASVAGALPQRITFKSFPDMLHETHHEIGKEEVVRTICHWLDENL